MSYNKLILDQINFTERYIEDNSVLYDPGHSVNLVDGNYTSTKILVPSGSGYYLTYTFDSNEEKQHLNKIAFQDDGNARDYDIEVSTDGVNYTIFQSIVGSTSNNLIEYTTNLSYKKYQSFRFKFTAFNYSGINTHTIHEVEAYTGPLYFTKDYNVEFDDALLDLEGWKNPRYEGSKLTGQKINEWNAGDITYGKNPVVENKTTALYIGNTLIGGEDEDESYAYIKRHSYVGINRILIINPTTDDVKLLDSTQEEFEPFHRFVTNDLPTGGTFNIRLLDFSIPNALDAIPQYYVKMNKGWLLKSFKSGPPTGLSTNISNPLFLANTDHGNYSGPETLKFQYLLDTASGTPYNQEPTYLSSRIYTNKYVSEYYTGSLIINGGTFSGTTLNAISSSDFIMQSELYLNDNLSTTELHLTLFDGTKDFAPGFNDERSISTFEVDRNLLSLNLGELTKISNDDNCGVEGLSPTGYIVLKGQTGSNQWPTTPTITDTNIDNYYLGWNGSSCVTFTDTRDKHIYVSGPSSPTGSYSGSFTYELSFLDKAHTLITNIPKEKYLPNGIGEKGYVIIPEQTDRRVKDNIDYYLEKAGLIEKTVTAKAPRRGR